MRLTRVVAQRAAIALVGVVTTVGCETGGDGDVMPSPSSQRPGTPSTTPPPGLPVEEAEQANLAACVRAQERSRQTDGTPAVKVYFSLRP
jgi:hypothetical protein